VYYRNRYYDPRIGRFTQQDPLGFVDGVNRYAYALNSPLNYLDPWGTMATGPSGMLRSIGSFLHSGGSFFMPNTFAEKAPGTWGDYALGGGKAVYKGKRSILSSAA